MDAAVSGADKQCGCLGCAALELKSAKKELTDKGWLAKVNLSRLLGHFEDLGAEVPRDLLDLLPLIY